LVTARAVLLSAALAAGCGASAAAQSCFAALAMALDVSSSVDAAENALQQEGLAQAFRDRAVIETILYPPGSGIMAAVYAWSGFQHQDVLVGWTWLGDEASILAFADQISGARRLYDHWPTSLGRAADFGARLHDENPIPCQRKILDISGDGANNDGVGPDWYRARGRFEDLTINGLVIQGADPDPVAYYRENVISGPGAFIEIAESYEDYPRAILRKLLRELQPPFANLAE
jgi:hypothetical protein